MKNAMWKWLGAPALAMVAAGLVVTQLPVSADAASIVKSGKDYKLNWSIDSDGKLLVEGKGNYASYEPEWIQYADLIKTAEVHVSDIDETSNFFLNCTNLVSVDLSDLDTSDANAMYNMFSGCKKLKSLDLSHLDTSRVQEMDYMFEGCTGLTTLDVSNFDTSDLISSMGMFADCSNLTSVELCSFDTPNLYITDFMFDGCKKLTNLDVSHINMEGVIMSRAMFRDCSSLTQLDLSDWYAPILEYADEMFSGCTQLTTIGAFPMNEGVRSVRKMFYNCAALSGEIDLGYGEVIYDECFTGAATVPGSGMVLNYGGGVTEKIAANIVNTKSENSNVHLGLAIPMVAVNKIVNAPKGIEITWNNVNPVDYYDIYRFNMDAFFDTEISYIDTVGPDNNKYLDEDVESGNSYYYFVIGSVGGNEYIHINSTTMIRMEASTIESITNTAKGMTLSWEPVDDAVGYYVYRSKGSGSYKKVKTLKADVWTDTAANENGAKYSYKVVPYGCRGCDFCLNEETTLKNHEKQQLYEGATSAVKVNYYLTVPGSLAIKNNTSKVLDVSWKKNAKATGYEIQYSLKSGFPKGKNTKSVKVTKAKTVKTTIKKLTKKKTYYVRIRAYKTVSKKDYYSAWSGSKKLKITK